MNHFQALERSLSTLSVPELFFFSLGCATRLAPVFRAFAHSESHNTYDAALDWAWSGVREPFPVAELRERSHQLRALGEFNPIDPPEMTLQAGRALSILTDTFEVATKKGARRRATSAAATALELLGGLDFVLIHGIKYVVVIDPRKPPEPGPLEAAEEALQYWSVELLQRSPRNIGSKVEELSKRSNAAQKSLIPEIVTYSRIRGWETGRGGEPGQTS